MGKGNWFQSNRHKSSSCSMLYLIAKLMALGGKAIDWIKNVNWQTDSMFKRNTGPSHTLDKEGLWCQNEEQQLINFPCLWHGLFEDLRIKPCLWLGTGWWSRRVYIFCSFTFRYVWIKFTYKFPPSAWLHTFVLILVRDLKSAVNKVLFYFGHYGLDLWYVR